MKRLLFFLGALIIGLNCSAVNSIQMTPFKTTAGIVSAKTNVINIELVNSDDIYAIQFYLYLPEGMSLPRRSSGSLYTTLDEEVEDDLEFTCGSSYNSTENYYTVMVYTTTSNVIPKGRCSLLSIRYTTESSMADGVYPVIIRTTKIETGAHVQTITPETSSYVVIGNAMPDHIDLSGMTGYIPSFVVDKLNSDMSASTKSLNLSSITVDNLGADIVAPSGSEMLWYTSDKASLNRTFTANKWTSVCLPVTLEVSSLLGTPVVKKMESYDDTEGTITLADVTTMEKGKPYMIKSGSDSQLFGNVSISDSESATESEAGSFVSGNMSMKGTYQDKVVSSTDTETYYGFSGGSFIGVTKGGTGRVKSFRAYLELKGSAGSRSISIDGEGTTSIDEIIEDDQYDSPIYNLQGVKMGNGHRAKGVYIRNGKKEIYK